MILTIEQWCKKNWYSVFDIWIEEAYNEYLEELICDIEFDWIEKNWNLRCSITNGNWWQYLQSFNKYDVIRIRLSSLYFKHYNATEEEIEHERQKRVKAYILEHKYY